MIHKKNKLEFFKINNCGPQKAPLRKWQDKPYIGRKHLQITSVLRLKQMKKSQNLIQNTKIDQKKIKHFAVSWTMASQRCPHPNPWNLWIWYYYLTWQEKPCKCDEIKDLEMGDYPDYSVGPSVTTRVLVKGRHEGQNQEKVMWWQKQRETLEDARLLVWKIDDGAMSQECKRPLEARKGRERDHPEPSEEIFWAPNCQINLCCFKPLTLL